MLAETIPVPNEALAGSSIKVILEDRTGTIWIGTGYDGVFSYQGEKFTSYSTRERPLQQCHQRSRRSQRRKPLDWHQRGRVKPSQGRQVHRLHYEETGWQTMECSRSTWIDRTVCWIATREGVNRLKDGKFTTYRVNDGLFSSFVYSFVEDDRGNLWMGCSKGIFRVVRQQLDDFADGKIKSFASVAYGLEHGFRQHRRGGRAESCFVQNRGWKSLVLLRSKVCRWLIRNAYRSIACRHSFTLKESASITAVLTSINLRRSAPPGRGDLVFRYTGLSFFAAEKVRFKYKLEGYDSDWVDAGDRREAYYSNIPPAQYVFRVMAVNSDGIWNEQGDSFTLRPEAAFLPNVLVLSVYV